VARCDDEIAIVVTPPDPASSFSWLIEVRGYADLSAVVGCGKSKALALEDALLTLRKLETFALLELIDEKAGL